MKGMVICWAYLASLSMSVGASCLDDLSASTAIPPGFPRIAISEVARNPYLFLSRENFGDHDRYPGVVLTYNGQDYLLALNGRQVAREGMAKLGERLNLPAGSEWLAKVGKRFENYDTETYPTLPLAKLWADIQPLHEISSHRFLDVFDPQSSLMLPKFFVGPEKADRIVIVAWGKAVARELPMIPRLEISVPVRSIGIAGAKLIAAKPVNPVWFQFPFKSGKIARVENHSDLKANKQHQIVRFIETLIQNNSIPVTGEGRDDAFTAFFNFEEIIKGETFSRHLAISLRRWSQDSRYDTISLDSVTSLNRAEAHALWAKDALANFEGGHWYHDIWIPASVGVNSNQSNKVIEKFLDIFIFSEDLTQEINALAPGDSKLIEVEHNFTQTRRSKAPPILQRIGAWRYAEIATEKREYAMTKWVRFYRDEKGRLAILSFN